MLRNILSLISLMAIACDGSRGTIATLSAAMNQLQDDSSVVARRVLVQSQAPDAPPLKRPMPDGRTLIGAEWSASGQGRIVIQDIRSGVQRDVTAEGDLGDDFELQSISPDGSRIAYLHRSFAPGCSELGCREIRVIGIDGSARSTLFKSDAFATIYSRNWAADNNTFAAQLRLPDWSQQVVLFNVKEGSSRVIRSFDNWTGPSQVSLSPDGNWLAYDGIPRGDVREISVLEVTGGRNVQITRDGKEKSLVGYAVDGSGLFYKVGGTLWYAPVQLGRPAGPPRIIRSGIIGSVQFTSPTSAGLHYVARYNQGERYSIRIDPESGRALSPAALVYTGYGSTLLYSPDASHVLYVNRPDAGEAFGNLVIQTVATGVEREIPLPSWTGIPVRWLPGTQSIELRMEVRGQLGLYRIDLATGRHEFVRPFQVDRRVLSPDGLIEYLEQRDSVGQDSSRLVAREVATGRMREIFRGSNIGGWVMRPNPDGKTIALRYGRHQSNLRDWKGGPARLILLHVNPGIAPKALYEINGRILQIDWSQSGRLLLFRTGDDNDTQTAIHLMTVATGRVETLYTGNPFRGGGLQFSGNDRYATFAREVNEQRPAELWVLENIPGSPSGARNNR